MVCGIKKNHTASGQSESDIASLHVERSYWIMAC